MTGYELVKKAIEFDKPEHGKSVIVSAIIQINKRIHFMVCISNYWIMLTVG